MNNKIKMFILIMAISVGFSVGTIAIGQNTHKIPATNQQTIAQPLNTTYANANSLDIVANPKKYLNKKVRIVAKFDKFSTLGLDYKPAFRSSDKYISILIKRDDVINHTVPLSEMKIFLTRNEAEKYIDLEAGDLIELKGYVFSDALGDTWFDVEKFTVLSSKSKDKTQIKK